MRLPMSTKRCFFLGGEEVSLLIFKIQINMHALQDQEAICFQMSMLVFKKQYGLRCPTSRKQIFWRLFVSFPDFFGGLMVVRFKMRFRGAFFNTQEASFSKRVSVFKMRLDGVGVVQWQSLVWLSKLGRIHIAGCCESALPRAPWYNIHLSAADIQNKVEQTPKLL